MNKRAKLTAILLVLSAPLLSTLPSAANTLLKVNGKNYSVHLIPGMSFDQSLTTGNYYYQLITSPWWNNSSDAQAFAQAWGDTTSGGVSAYFAYVTSGTKVFSYFSVGGGNAVAVSNNKSFFLQSFAAGVPLPSTTTACLLYTSPSPRDLSTSRMPSSA